MSVSVWVDGWQLQCCGRPFGVGEEVTWRCADPDLRWLESVLPRDVAHRISYAEEHHDEALVDRAVLRGTVVAIHAAFARYTQLDADDRTLHAVSGSGLLRAVRRADGNEGGETDARFNGYVVEVDVLPAPA
ncbi:DUF6578 domain-containing protein [Cellulomonas dongxiuzhuiae]|uniref:DUF6578 domain-containing protein n=1 Tax=Cellulomonas dongxiuzhuiae TaxID=2819979 RepID=UPI001AAF2CC1|nr:DUF6578 domain-containing protein [Cellulomonas dongxiuzhuiae]MBO3090069.1 hypothetical protein [Cellulomonas dongxiuzhuiae]